MNEDWSELVGDLLFSITNNLKNLDYIRFGAVCFEWRSFCIQNYEHIKIPSNLPLLLIPTPPCHEDYYNDEDDDEYDDDEEDKQEILHDEEEQLEILQDDFDVGDVNHEDGDDDEHEEEEEEQLEILPDDPYYYVDDEDEEPLEEYYKPKMIWRGQDAETRYKSTRSFYSLSEGKVYRDFQLPVPYYKNCRGSSHGWLVTVDEEEEQPDGTTTYTYPVRLLNPFRSVNNEIQLPSLTTIVDDECEQTSSFYLHKAFLSANPSSLSNPSDLIVFGVYAGNRLGFCSPGDSAWTLFPLENKFRPIEDLICYKGRFLAIIQNGSVMELEFAPERRSPSVKFVARTPPNADNLTQKYLVESAGDLLQVHRDVFLEDGDDNCSTIGFRLFKLLLDDDDAEWVEMDNLDGRMLFLGDNNSISLSATDFPGCMPDCIYFTDDNYGYYDAGSGATDFGIFNFVDKSFARFCPMRNGIMPQPIWIQPML